MMLQPLIDIDHQLLVAINQLHAPWADSFFWVVSRANTWLPLYVILVALIVLRWRQPVKHIPAYVWILFGFALSVGLSDFVSSGLIKPWIMRLRPTHNPSLLPMLHLVNNYQGGQYGFVSSHAANTMACALLFALLYRNKWSTILLMIWVAINCYSRMYLGVHYPLDIVGGLLVGSTLAWLTYRLLLRMHIVPYSATDVSASSCSLECEDETRRGSA